MVFNDLGSKHIILDKTGKEKGKFHTQNLKKEKKEKLRLILVI